jgi:hypothetical protein
VEYYAVDVAGNQEDPRRLFQRPRGDLSGDGAVGQTDLDIVLSMWGRSGSAITDGRADANHDGYVGQDDLDIILPFWGDDITYTLTVSNGTGSGAYRRGTVVDISANAAPSGKTFDKWTGDTAWVADATAASTTVTMPPANAAVTATYRLKGDLNSDGFVGQTDLDIVLSQWGRSGPEISDPHADANHDGFVGQVDLDTVLANWGKGVRP